MLFQTCGFETARVKKIKIILSGLMFVGLALTLPAQSSLTNGLLAYYPFNGNANDESGYGNHGVVMGATLTQNRFGEENKAYFFNGSGNRISAVVTNQPLGNAPRTLVAWLKPEAISYVIWGLIAQGRDDCSGYMFGLTRHSGGHLGFWGGCQDWGTSLVASNSQWYFVALTFDGAVAKLFMNGTWQTNRIGTLNTRSARLWMGAETTDDGAYFRYFYHGTIDDVRLFNRALTTEELDTIYAMESLPKVKVVKAITVDCANLSVGSNYQLQVSSDMNVWTNWGTPFTATNATFFYRDYEQVDDWGQRFFRLSQP